MKNLSIIIICLFLNVGFTQDFKDFKNVIRNSTENEILSYIEKAKNDGITIIEAENIIKAQGGTNEELNRFKRLWNFGNTNVELNNIENTSPVAESYIGKKTPSTSITDKKNKRFGESFFNNANISESPQLYLATPNDYRLGPGDEISVNLYGAAESTYNVVISREGNVKFDKLAPIFLSGLSFTQAKIRLKNRLSNIYTGLNSNNDLDKIDLDLSLIKARSIVVNIVGNVNAPGTYTISGFSSILNALFFAGGPNEIGSYRDIQIKRNGINIKNIDLYKYFTEGEYPNFYLRDQDVIFVPNIAKEVIISSGFRLNTKFELLESESFSDLINYSGGFNSKAFKEKIFVDRINGLEIELQEINKSNFNNSIPHDGDIVRAKFPLEYNVKENVARINGSVILPGDYSLDSIANVNDLIISSKGFARDALASKAILYRYNNGIQNEVISLNLDDKNNRTIKIKPLDNLYIPSLSDLQIQKNIFIRGYVKKPGKYVFRDNMTVRDLIIEADGFEDFGDQKNIILYRNKTTDNKEIVESFKLSYDDDFNTPNNIKLEPYDLISVQKIEYLEQIDSYNIKGEVASSGTYAITSNNFKVSDALKTTKFKNTADLSSIYLRRNGINIPIEIDENSYNVKNNINMLAQDEIFIPKINNTITISGAVNNQVIIPFSKKYNVKKIIYQAGGLKRDADLNNIYINSLNGESKAVKKFLFIRMFPKLKKGDIINVPIKVEKERKSAAEILSLASGITSIVALIRIISQN